jgi:hypothetical protein
MKVSILLLWLLAITIYRRRSASLGGFIKPIWPTLQLSLIRSASTSLP